MKFFKNIPKLKTGTWKKTGLVIGGVVVLIFALTIVGSLGKSLLVPALGLNNYGQESAYSIPGYEPQDDYYQESGSVYDHEQLADLSLRNTKVSREAAVPAEDNSVGNDAENFEVTQYNVSIETRNLDKECNVIENLKPLVYVVFENANVYDSACNYTFKVATQNVPEILTVIEQMNPENLNQNTRTIKNALDDFISETDILENKLKSIETTLNQALASYDEITLLATRSGDAESLTKIVDSKIGIIERLTREKLAVSAQLDRLSRSKSEQLDRLEYTYFYLNIIENKFVDGRAIGDSWKYAIQDTVYDINRTIQNITVGLASLLFVVLQYALYLLVLLLLAKYGWKAAKYIWKK